MPRRDRVPGSGFDRSPVEGREEGCDRCGGDMTHELGRNLGAFFFFRRCVFRESLVLIPDTHHVRKGGVFFGGEENGRVTTSFSDDHLSW